LGGGGGGNARRSLGEGRYRLQVVAKDTETHQEEVGFSYSYIKIILN
jgi:hypothetical protein